MSQSTLDATQIPLKRLFKPVVGVYPAAKVISDGFSTSAQSFGDLGTSGWQSHATRFNVQGQQWFAFQGWNPPAGCKNAPTPRQVLGVAPGHVLEFEFEFNDDKLDIMVNATDAFDMQVYVTEGGQTFKLRDKPLAWVGGGYKFRNILFADRDPRQIRVVMAGGVNFTQLNHEARAVVRPSKDRPFIITDGDSYFESIHALNLGSDETYYAYGNCDAIFEATGFAQGRHAEGGTGAFNNGDGNARTDDTPSAVASSRWGSAQRIAKIAVDLGRNTPVAYLCNGTINDGPLSGGKAPMKARLLQIWEALNAVDPDLPIIHIGPEPYNGGVTPGSSHDLNRQAMIEGLAGYANGAGFIDPSLDPQGAWYTGTGFDNSPTSSEQAALTGHDGIHGNYRGYKWYGTLIARHLGEITIPAARAAKFL